MGQAEGCEMSIDIAHNHTIISDLYYPLRYNVPVMDNNFALYKTMLLIRRFEERLLAEFSAGKLVGTTHTYIGQEADAAGIFSVTDPDDVVFSNHRCHGHFLAYGGEPYRLAAELMGKSTGLVEGAAVVSISSGGIFTRTEFRVVLFRWQPAWHWQRKPAEPEKSRWYFLGDGTLGEGVLYESLNIAALWKLPILFVLENNGYAQTTPVEKGVAGSMPDDLPLLACRSGSVILRTLWKLVPLHGRPSSTSVRSQAGMLDPEYAPLLST